MTLIFWDEKCIITIPKLVFGYTASHVFQHSLGSLLVFLSWNSTRYALLEGIKDSPTHPTAVFSLNYFIQKVFLMWCIKNNIMDFAFSSKQIFAMILPILQLTWIFLVLCYCLRKAVISVSPKTVWQLVRLPLNQYCSFHYWIFQHWLLVIRYIERDPKQEPIP